MNRVRPREGTLLLMLCVNYHHNGVFDGLCRGVAIDGWINLESPYVDRHLKAAIEDTNFTLGKSHSWIHYGHQCWVGNWCWDAVRVTAACAADVLNFVLRKGYHPESGACVLFDKIDRRETLTWLDLAYCLEG